ncbi:hypothetical protein DM872_12360 [Pseudomonas taiwanensis]|uniref:MBL fold metallo-hydrolase n=1 Tax=Pseudomonas taiwanensis TaxID=470150 RepID=UPI0015BDACDF|nr:hypothetical protein [Pseudomonas taiwanensis]
MTRRLSVLAGRMRKLDGGSMFGSLPRQHWADWVETDPDNQIALGSRVLLVQEPGRNVLIMAGSEPLLAPVPRTCRCQPQPLGLLDSLAQRGLDEDDIDTVILCHVQALLPPDVRSAFQAGDPPRLLFPRAAYVTGARQWSRALRPHPRDRIWFVPQILDQLESSGRLELVEDCACDVMGEGWKFHVSDGYTPGQLLPELEMPGGPVVFAGDLIPGLHWLDLDMASAFDRNPECLVEEKESLLDHIVAAGGRLMLARDPAVALAKVTRDRQSRYCAFDHHRCLDRCET